jgi:hypothetical protein
MRDVFPGYDVLAKRETPSWNDKTRAVIDARLRVADGAPRFFEAAEFRALTALCDCICPQRELRIPVAALVDEKMHANHADGFRLASMPNMRDAWRRGLAAIDEAARMAHGRLFHECPRDVQNDMVERMSRGALDNPAWNGLSPRDFFQHRVLPDVVKSYYSHPDAWSEIGFGGPASPRGYVRMDFDQRDPWEAAEAKPGEEARAFKDNRRVDR